MIQSYVEGSGFQSWIVYFTDRNTNIQSPETIAHQEAILKQRIPLDTTRVSNAY